MATSTGKFYAYIRVSSVGQGAGDGQREQINTMQYQFSDWFEDLAYSGKTLATERPGFSALLNTVKAGDTVVVSELSRLGRNTLDALNTIETFSKRGVKLQVVQMPDVVFGTTTGDLLTTIMLAVAKMENDQRRERCRAGIVLARAEGVYKGRPKGCKNKELSPLAKRVRELIKDTSLGDTAIGRTANCSRATVARLRKEMDEAKQNEFSEWLAAKKAARNVKAA